MPELTLSAIGDLDCERPREVPTRRLLAVRDLARRFARDEGLTDPADLESCVRVAVGVLNLGVSAARAVRTARITAQTIAQANGVSAEIESGTLRAVPDPTPQGRVTVPRHQLTTLRRAAGELLDMARDNRDSLVATYGDDNQQVRHPEEAHTLAELEFEIARAQRALAEFDKVCPLHA